ncbi:MAG TPA: ABC transporter permease, partial [Bryobacteraceae bacterium]
MLSDLSIRFRSLFRRRAAETDLEDELRFHLERQREKYLKAGLSPGEARRRARLEFGGVGQIKDDCRDARGVSVIEAFLHDLRYAVRTLSKSPGFTAVALLTLALGIGANTAIFSIVYSVLLRPLPYREPSRLVILNETTPKVGMVSVSYPNFLDWRAQNHTFSSMSSVHQVSFNLAGVAQPENVEGAAVSANFLSLLGVQPILGRGFAASEDRPGTPPVILLSYRLWQSHFGAESNVIGRAVALDGRSYTIAGVLPAGFRWIENADVIEPIGVWATDNDAAAERGERDDSSVVGRLAAGTTLTQARAEMEGIAARLARAYPAANDQFGVALRPIRDVFVGDSRSAILVFWGAVVFVLLVACANVA